MLILDGKAVAATRRELLKTKITHFQQNTGRVPHLVVVIVGDNPASQIYVRNKVIACVNVGMKSSKIELPATTTQLEMNALIDKLNLDSGVDGVLVQLPLPKGLSEDEINSRLSPLKDADGFSFSSLGHLLAGQPLVKPCTPFGIMLMLEHYKIPVAGKNVVVVGRSNIVGKPMALLLTMADATVTLCHSKTKNLREFTSRADIVIVAAGKKHLLGKDDFKKDAVVIDVGMHGSGKGQPICGDVRMSELEGCVSACSPVPGGVGPMTISTLLENTVHLAEQRKLKNK